MTRTVANYNDRYRPQFGCTQGEWERIVDLAIDYQAGKRSDWPSGKEPPPRISKRLWFARYLYRTGRLTDG